MAPATFAEIVQKLKIIALIPVAIKVIILTAKALSHISDLSNFFRLDRHLKEVCFCIAFFQI